MATAYPVPGEVVEASPAVPLFLCQKPQLEASAKFLGTCTRLGNGLLATAYHVVDGVKGGTICVFANGHLCGMSLIAVSREHDLALLHCKWLDDPRLDLLEKDCPHDIPLMTMEYSRTKSGGDFQPVMSIRHGHLVRYFHDQLYAPHTLELSYPALRGASGAPVLACFPKDEKQFRLCGIVVANAEYQLLPVSSVTVKDDLDGRTISETHNFYLPAGVATHVKHLKSLIDSVPSLPGQAAP